MSWDDESVTGCESFAVKMAGQKFFSGLTDAMINRTSDRPDRQKSSFYWPDEYMQDSQDTFRTSNGGSGASSRRPSTASSSATATPKECMSPVGAFGESADVLKQRHQSNARSHIKFFDDCDSSFTALEREKQRAKLGIEKFLREQDDDVSEVAKTRRQNTLKSNFQFYDVVEQPQQQRTPSRQQTNGNHQPASTPDYPEDHTRFSPVMSNGAPPVQSFRRQQSSPASSEYHYSARYTGSYDDFEDEDRCSYKSNDYNFSPPGTPNSGGEIPEHKRNSQRHLRSSIAFCNGVAIAEDSSASRKPVSVRDAASTQRVGVGLPNL